MYAVGVETAAARGPLWVTALLAGLDAARPTTLISPLHPDTPAFAHVLGTQPDAARLAEAFDDGRLNLFTADASDPAQLLFTRGAAGYVQELEHHGVVPGSLIVVDQADDLFSAHDHAALCEQARLYADWSQRHGHTLLLLFLRSSPLRPVLEGNQAAVQHCSGLATVQAEGGQLQLRVDFWQTPDERLLGHRMALSGRPAAAVDPAPAAQRRRHPRQLPRVWYCGPTEPALESLRDRIQWLEATSLDDIVRKASQRRGANALIGLDGRSDFGNLLEQLRLLRDALGPQARIVLRESGWRLREHLQRRLLLGLGIDTVIAPGEPAASWPALLLGERDEGPALVDTVTGAASLDDWPRSLQALQDLAPGNSDGWLPPQRFLTAAAERVARQRALGVPCTLAEVELLNGDLPAGDAPGHTRQGDVATRWAGALFFLLVGCRQRDAVAVLDRWSAELGDSAPVGRISLSCKEAAIDARLAELATAVAPPQRHEVPTVSSDGKVVAMPSGGRGSMAAALVGGLSTALLALSALGLGAAPTPASAQRIGAGAQTPRAAVAPVADSASRAYAEQRYPDAARLGLIEIEQKPGDVDLRLKLANSLAWTGDYPRALQHYRALAGTRWAAAGLLGQANVLLWSGRPEQADPLLRQVLTMDRRNTDAQESLAMAGRQLRPRSSVQLGSLKDSGDASRQTLELAHRWWNPMLDQVFEASTEFRRETDDPKGVRLNPVEFGLHWEHRALAWRPRVSATLRSEPRTQLYAEGSATLLEGAVVVTAGRIDWGKAAFSPQALRDGLSARHLQLDGRLPVHYGLWQAQWQHFSVSDGNRLNDLSLEFTPEWKPFQGPWAPKVVIGLYSRTAAENVPRYWSPADGHHVANASLVWGRWERGWELQGVLKRAQRLGGEGANGWSASVGGKRWLSADLALRAEAAHDRNRRGGSGYQATSASVALEKLW